METRHILDRLDAAVLVLDDEWRVESINERAGRVFDCRPDDVRGEVLWETVADDHPAVDEQRYRTAMDEDEPDSFEARSESLGRWLDVRLDPSPASLLVVVRDVTDRKERERRLRRQTERLEQIASIVNHDFRNPLGIANGNVDLALDFLSDVDDAAADRVVDRVESTQDALGRMDSLVEHVVTIARKGNPPDDVEPLSLREVAESSWQTATRDVASDPSASLTVDADPHVLADEARLSRLLEHLFRNALEHAGPDVTVTVDTLDDGFSVADDGPGIPEAEREDVFEFGYTTVDGNDGFGLTVVEALAGAHGWSVDVTEPDDGGAKVSVRGVHLET